jgi:hypothetical protein
MPLISFGVVRETTHHLALILIVPGAERWDPAGKECAGGVQAICLP